MGASGPDAPAEPGMPGDAACPRAPSDAQAPSVSAPMLTALMRIAYARGVVGVDVTDHYITFRLKVPVFADDCA